MLLVLDMVHVARGRGLVAAAGEPAVPVPQGHRVADPGRDRLGVPDVQRQARPAQPRAELPAAPPSLPWRALLVSFVAGVIVGGAVLLGLLQKLQW